MSEKKRNTALEFIKTHKKEIAISAISVVAGGLATYVGVKSHYRKKAHAFKPLQDMLGILKVSESYYYDIGGPASSLKIGDLGKLTDIMISDESFNPDVGGVGTEITGVIIGIKDGVGK